MSRKRHCKLANAGIASYREKHRFRENKQTLEHVKNGKRDKARMREIYMYTKISQYKDKIR